MTRRLIGAVLAVVITTSLLPVAQANLILSTDSDASISSLSEQVLAQPRSAAGRRKNVWDADPPEAASAGSHYFVYDIGPDGKGIDHSDQPIGFNAIVAGPGYNVTCQILVVDPGGFYGGGNPFWLGIPTSTDPDHPQNFYNIGQNFEFYECGVVRFQFQLTNAAAAGQISGTTDSSELAYTGAKDSGGNFIRGTEQVRIVTSTNAGHDDDAITAEMTTTVPSDFVDGYTMDFAPGYLTFNEGTFTGEQVAPAILTIPEPTSLAAMGLAGGLLTRRRVRR